MARPRKATAAAERDYVRLLLPAILAITTFAVVPLIGMFALSLSDFNLINGWSGEVGFRNFLRLWNDTRFVNSVYVLAALTVFGVTFQVVLGTAIAVGLHKIVSNWKLARGLFMIPYAVPNIAVALLWLSLFTPTLSPINSFFEIFGITFPAMLTTQTGAITAIVIADTWSTYPFVMLLILAALNGISQDLDEAAALDGATRIQTFFFITLPLLMPALLMVSLFRFIDELKHFPLIFVMTQGGPGRSTQVTNFYAYVTTFQNSNVAYGASMAVFLFLFAAAISFYVARMKMRLSDA